MAVATKSEENFGGLGVLRRESQKDEHEGHNWERTETLYDNSVEYVAWAFCYECNTDFFAEMTTIIRDLEEEE